jgi:hypothetical protein
MPKEIADRCTFKTTPQDFTPRIHKIAPLQPCECGKELENTRLVRLQKNSEPQPHWREYCYTCKLVSVLNANDWKTAHELNAEMRLKAFDLQKNNQKD